MTINHRDSQSTSTENAVNMTSVVHCDFFLCGLSGKKEELQKHH